MTFVTRARRARAATFAALAALAAGLAGATPAAADPAGISGTLTDARTGAPIPNAIVAVATAGDYGFVGWTGTDAAGHYAFDGLTAGTAYVLSAAPPAPYRLQWLPADPESGPPPSFVAPATVDAALSAGTPVSGTLRTADGSPAAGATVFAERVDGEDGSLVAATDETGAWSAYADPGTYVVGFSYEDRWTYAYGKTDQAAADRIVVGTSPVVVDDTIPAAPPPTSVAGRVTDAVTGAPVEGVCATLEKAGDPGGLGSACTDANGDYLLAEGLPGTWVVRVEDEQGRYATGRSEPFDLAEGQALTGTDVQLTRGGTLAGLAVDSATGAPLADICPAPYAGRQGDYLRSKITCSDASGRWSVSGLPAGATTVQLNGDATHVAKWARNAQTQAEATVFTVAPDTTTDAGTVRLRHGGVVTGRVTNQAGEPVAGAWVELGGYHTRCGVPCGPSAGRTGADGGYRIENVPPQTTIAAVVAPGQPYAVQWSGGATDPADARQLRIAYDRTTRLDAVLKPAAALAVTVTGLPAGEWAMVDAYTLSGAPVSSGDVNGPGTVTLGLLPASRVKVKVTYGDEGSETSAWYGGTSLETARPIRVAPDRNAAVTVALPS